MNIKLLILAILLASSSLLGYEQVNINKYFNAKTCDQVLLNKGLYKTCYDYNAKGARYVSFTLDASIVNQKNIKKRPSIRQDKNIPKKYRSSYGDYKKNKYKNDAGHLASHESFNNSQKNLKTIYVASNFIPQHYSLNRSSKAWKGLEKFGRTLAVKMGSVNVLNGVIYGKKPKRIGHNQIAVPKAFWKMFYNNKMNYQRCFYFENKPKDKKKRIKDYEVSCKSLL